MFGQGVGFIGKAALTYVEAFEANKSVAGGTIGNKLGVRAPFQVAFATFLFASAYVRFAVPFIPPELASRGVNTSVTGKIGFFAPLKVFLPQLIYRANGTFVTHYGVSFLCAGIFLGVVCRDASSLLPSHVTDFR